MKINAKTIKRDIKDNIKQLKQEVKSIKKDEQTTSEYWQFVKAYLIGYIHWLKAILMSKDCKDIQKYWIVDDYNKKTFLKIFYLLHDTQINCGDVYLEEWEKFLQENMQKVHEKIKIANKYKKEGK